MDKTHELHTRDCTSFTRLRCRQLKMALKLNVTVPKNCDTEQTKTKTELQAALQPSLPPPGGLRDNELCRRKVDHFLPGEITMVTDDEYITWCGAGDVQSFDLKSAAELNKSTE